jgi:Antitoxin ParD
MRQHAKQKTVRLTIDFPVEQHTYIKMLAAKEGLSLRQFVIEHLPGLNESKTKKKHKNASDKEFDALLKEFLVEKAPMLKRLSKK